MDKDKEMKKEARKVRAGNETDLKLVKKPKELNDPKDFEADCTTHRKQ